MDIKTIIWVDAELEFAKNQLIEETNKLSYVVGSTAPLVMRLQQIMIMLNRAQAPLAQAIEEAPPPGTHPQ